MLPPTECIRNTGRRRSRPGSASPLSSAHDADRFRGLEEASDILATRNCDVDTKPIEPKWQRLWLYMHTCTLRFEICYHQVSSTLYSPSGERVLTRLYTSPPPPNLFLLTTLRSPLRPTLGSPSKPTVRSHLKSPLTSPFRPSPRSPLRSHLRSPLKSPRRSP